MEERALERGFAREVGVDKCILTYEAQRRSLWSLV